MSLSSHVILYKRIKKLIQLRATGSPEDLANKLNISERQLYNYISDMKSFGYNIGYSKMQQTYYFSEEAILSE
jgi:transcriptional antiterminator